MKRRVLPGLILALISLPLLAGLAGTIGPAFGYLPALGGNRLTIAPFERLAAQPHLLQSALVGLATGLVTTGVSLALVALFTAAYAGTRMFSRVQHLVSPLLAVPHAAAAFGLAFLIAPSGLAMRLVSPELTGYLSPPDWLVPGDTFGLSMMAGLIVKEIPFLFLVTLAALPQTELAQARRLATSLGYGRVRGFLIATWPLVYRQIRLPVFAVLAYAGSVVDVAMILGPDLPAPLAVRIAGWMADPDLQMRFLASAAALLQLGLTLAAMLVWRAIEIAGALLLRRMSISGLRCADDRLIRGMACAAMGVSALLVILGLVVLLVWSFAGLWPFPALSPQVLTLKAWMRVLPQIAVPLATTMALAGISAVIALMLAIGLLWRTDLRSTGLLQSMLYLPLVVPQLSFLFGLQILSLTLGFGTSFPLLLFVHLIFVLPYVVLSLSDPWHAFDRRFETIAAGFGKSPWQTLLHIRLPMLMRACLTAFAVGFAVSAGLYLPTLLIGAGRIVTITTEAVALSSGGDRRTIGVYALLQTIIPFAGFAIASLMPQLLFRHRRAMRI
ncbi:ABC transporter permease [Rhizobium sp. Root482]|uniref:ABC transporter permease n=1 Tax=Rhizobium sp. Root482 TaxID=1736543 RepID=UPI0006F8DD35|nr:ABC transporter permease [Rhizobium sp. Root482]KQY25790.1 ABC transporter permease [Rhizobium sp. Root482]